MEKLLYFIGLLTLFLCFIFYQEKGILLKKFQNVQVKHFATLTSKGGRS
jgi:hypothetical protein